MNVFTWKRAAVIGALVSGCTGNPSHGAEVSSIGQGSEGATCYPDGRCNAGLSCLRNLCVSEDSGTPGTGGATSRDGSLLTDGAPGDRDASNSGDTGDRDASNPTDAGGACAKGPCRKVLAVSAGGSHACALLSGGTVECWGEGMQGQLGNGAVASSSIPVQVSNLTGVTAIATGLNLSCARMSGGTGECWGLYNPIQPEQNSSYLTPAEVPDLTGVTAIGAGIGYACALLSNGGVKCWGSNNTHGELGNGTLGDFLLGSVASPASVSGVTTATAIAVGQGTTCALLSGGTVECWGLNQDGELGNGTVDNSPSPVSVSSLTRATAISVGGDHVCALVSGGTVECWGYNHYGQVGNGTTAYSSPLGPVSDLANVTAISAGSAHTCALLSGGTVECWGDDSWGQLGNGTGTADSGAPSSAYSATPAPVRGLTGVTAITAGGQFSCALLSDGAVECWGRNLEGELGNGTQTSWSMPAPVSL